MSTAGPVVTPGNAWIGGSKNSIGPPTSVSGSFQSVGAPGFPTPSVPSIATARNNSGSNVRIPYARLVSLRSPSNKPNFSGKPQNEYDNLETGEVAWIKGRSKDQPTMHAAGGLGYGVDRMQRLAHTDWVDKDVGKQQRAVDVPAFFDIPDRAKTIFLKTVDAPAGADKDGKKQNMKNKKEALKTLNEKLQNDGGVFQWRPDGMVLSKLESPAGDTISSQQLDARQAQLFNIAVQGPALAKSWTGDSKLASMPMDRVFMALVAEFEDDGTNSKLQKFRVMRTTSSHLVAYSATDDRCGLRKKDDTVVEPNGKTYTYSGDEVIVGAWCIGTVLDSAASRSTVGSLVRTAPASMALNVNVNVQWWSGDRLHNAYMGTNVLQRGQSAPKRPASSSSSTPPAKKPSPPSST